MAKTKLIIGLVALLWAHGLMGDSFKTAEFVSSSNVLRMVEFYHSKTGDLPSSWSEVGKLVDFDKLFKNFDFKSKFGFPNQDLQIKYDGDSFRIVAMSIDSTSFKDVNIAGKPSRIILIHNDAKKFAVVHMTEEALLRVFDQAEYSLGDYTGADGKWANSEEVLGNWKNPTGDPVSPPEANHNSNSRPDLSQEPSVPKEKNNSDSEPARVVFVGWLVGTLVIMFFGSLAFVLRSKRRFSGDK